MKTKQQMLEDRNAAMEKCRTIMKGAAKDADGNPMLNAEQAAEFDKWEADYKKFDADLKGRDKDLARKLFTEGGEGDTNPDEPTNRRTSTADTNRGSRPTESKWNPTNRRSTERIITFDGPRGSQEYESAFGNAMRGVPVDKAFAKFKAETYQPHNAPGMQSDIEEKGGYFLVSEQMAEGIIKAVDDATPMQRLCKLITVRNSRSLGIRKRVSKVNSFQWSQELTDLTTRLDTSLAYGKRVLTPHYIGGGIPISRDLIRSAAQPVESMVLEELGIDLGEKVEYAGLYGTGGQQPLGVMTADPEGIPTTRDVTYDATTTAFTFKSLIKAKYSLKPRYRGSARWMFHRDRIADLAMLTDSTGQFLWQPAKAVGDPDTVLGLPVDESEWMPSAKGASLYYGLLADWSMYWLAYGLDMEIMRLTEIRALTNEVLYLCRAKIDGMPMIDEAFVRLQYAAS